MNRRVLGPLALTAVVVLGGATSFAQDAPPATSAGPAPGPAASDQPAAPATSGAPPASAAPSGSAAPAAPADSSSPAPASSAKASVMSFTYGDHSRKASAPAMGPMHHARMVRHAGEALATFTGFEMLADGGSRLFVQLSRTVDVEQSKDASVAPRAGHARKGKRGRAKEGANAQATNRIVFTLKGAELGRFNDENSLETMHFNTPVLRARLVPAGKDLHFVVVLRQDVTPTMKSVPAKDNGSIVQIDFPQGTYLPAGDAQVSPQSGAKEPVQGALPSNDSADSSGNTQ